MKTNELPEKEMGENLCIRKAEFSDLPRITEIYNQAVVNTTATMDTEKRTEIEGKRWFQQHEGKYPVLVAEWGGTFAGWGSLSPWSDRIGYSRTVELSFYVREEFRGKGIGKKLMEALLAEGARYGFHSILSRITSDNQVSLGIHRIFGFREVGVLKDVGRKFDRWHDVIIMELLNP
jgi:phosphinothricin acetyltransferase